MINYNIASKKFNSTVCSGGSSRGDQRRNQKRNAVGEVAGEVAEEEAELVYLQYQNQKKPRLSISISNSEIKKSLP